MKQYLIMKSSAPRSIWTLIFEIISKKDYSFKKKKNILKFLPNINYIQLCINC